MAPATARSPSPWASWTPGSALLARLPAETLHVSFLGPSGTQTHTEVGPSLLTVLAAARIWPTLKTWVAAVGLDNYVGTGSAR